jgi:2-oxoglutarate dehydrogenase E2 component (dihydrolipoamide succinyltransferase)
VSVEISAPVSGILKEILKDPNEPIVPGDVLGRIEAAAKDAAKTEAETAAAEDALPGRRERSAARSEENLPGLSPAVRRLLEKSNIDPAEINGSGRGGRITAEDVENYLKRRVTETPAAVGVIPGRKVPHNALRRSTARHMVESMLKIAPHVTAVFDADMSSVINHRNKHKAEFQDKGGNLTYTAYFVKAAVQALQAVPEINSRWHDDALEIFEEYNIGIAAATDSGLIVPVIAHAQNLDLSGIAERLQDLTARARDGKLSQKEVQNGTFTITNHGMTGSLIATPVIHQPQSAILGIGKLEKRVVVVEKEGKDTTGIKPMIYVTLTVDHRALDGFQANRFLTKFVEVLENWS